MKPDREKALDMWRAGAPPAQIAKECGYASVSCVSSAMSQLCKRRSIVTRRSRKRGGRTRVEQAVALKQQGMRPFEIARHMGTSKANVYALIAYARNKQKRHIVYFGGPPATLRNKIVDLYKSGAKARAIADTLGIKPGAVWSHITKARAARELPASRRLWCDAKAAA